MRDVYIAIMRAAARGEGVHLSADEAFDLSLDDAISTRATNGLIESEWERICKGPGIAGWRNISTDRAGKKAENMKSGPAMPLRVHE